MFTVFGLFGIYSLTLVAPNIAPGVSFPCGCITKEQFFLWKIEDVKVAANKFHKEHGEYPDFKELNKYLENSEENSFTKIRVYRWSIFQPQTQEGIYYSKTENGFRVKGLAWGDIVGIPILANVETQKSTVDWPIM